MNEKKSFWSTLPGVLTAVAALITSISGIIAVLFQVGVIGPKQNLSSDYSVTLPNLKTENKHVLSPPINITRTHLQDLNSQQKVDEQLQIVKSNLLMIGRVEKLKQESIIVSINYDLAASLDNIFIQGNNGNFIIAEVQKRFANTLSAKSLQQGEIQIGASVFIYKK